ncbi:MAG: hypothetical protein A2V81_00090 [Candidatus Abawacabacteria bacterium RBG_16_42_10]|uniref:PKD domain-containing protein n=1 Tax=Candidatus Abawacabacteria bacterium RBG_16_42_10 TaxID=1817814 RepID=A0A1F4XLI7_9BACT|nr:MAG: hypothetical protein A2V81_00090 [Candidatus Abawacabacteria bacterium RBG_16_42_10]
MKGHHKLTLRIVAWSSLISMSVNMFAPVFFVHAQTPTLGTVDILSVEQEGMSDAVINFQTLPEGLTVTARVDPDGNGDFLTLRSALTQIKNGVIAVSEGRLNEHDLIIPPGVIVRGGYDSRTWTAQFGKATTIFGLPGKTSIVLMNGSGLQNIILEQADTAVRIADGAATLSKVVVLQAKKAVELGPFAVIRIANSDFVQNEKVILGSSNTKAYIFQSIFQDNQTLISENLHSSSFIKDSIFFPNKNSLANIQDQNNLVRTDKPLPQAGWQFPEESTARTFDESFTMEGKNDDRKQSLSGPDIRDPAGINALLVYYQLPEGDILKIVDRSNFSSVVFQTPHEGGSFRGWIPVPLSTELTMLLVTNGDNNLPLQIGVSRIAKIPESSYITSPENLTQGVLGNSAEIDIFYRDLGRKITTHPLTLEEKDRLKSISRPVVIAGEDWSNLNQTTLETLEEASELKGFVSRILLAGDNPSLAFGNYEERPRQNNDSRYMSLLSDYLAFEKTFKLDDQMCEELTTCPWTATGLRSFLPLISLPLKEDTGVAVNENGLFSSEGWGAPSATSPTLKIDTQQNISQGDFVWTQQVLGTTPTTTSHLITFHSGNVLGEHKNSISLSINPDGNIKITSWDKNGIRKISDTSAVSWESSRKYKMILSINGNIATLTRDNVSVWSDQVQLDHIQKIQAGKSPILESQNHIPQILSDVSIWQKQGNTRVFAGSEGNPLRGTLGPDDSSLSGVLQFQTADLCRENSINLKNSDAVLATFSGIVEGTQCKLSLTTPTTDSAVTDIPVEDLKQTLYIVWNFDPISSLGTISLLSEKEQILTTLPSFFSQPLRTPLLVSDLIVESSATLTSAEIHYFLLPQITSSNLTTLLPVSRYEVIYDTDEEKVRRGDGSIAQITVEDIRKIPTPKKTISGLEANKRYFFAVRAILEDGTASETTNIRNLQIQNTGEVSSLEAGSVGRSNVTTTLALGNDMPMSQVFAQVTETDNSVAASSVLRGRLGDPLTLSSANSSGGASFVAWTLGRDLPSSTNEQPEHIYTMPGNYIVSELRKLRDGTILKQFGLVAVGHQPSESPRITAETWTASPTDPMQTWTSKSVGRNIPAIVGINEPIFLLGNAVDVGGNADNAYTWNYKVYWGDGTEDETDAVKNAFNKTRLVGSEKEENPITHRYATPGIYTIVSQVTDDQNNIGVFENTVIVTAPEAYPQKIVSLSGIGRILSLSGGTPPYTVTLLDGSTQNLARNISSLPVTVNGAGTITVRDSLGNETTVAVEITDNPAINTKEIYLPSDRSLEVTPNSLKTKETTRIKAKGEEHLFRETENVAYHFGDILPPHLANELPILNSTLAYSTSTEITTEPFLTMGTYPAILTAIEGRGTEKKKAFSIQIQEARFTAQSNEGIITGTLAPSLSSIPESVEIWDRGIENVRLTSITPNQTGRFIYIVPDDGKKKGLLTLRLRDKTGEFSTFAKNIHYNIQNRPETINGLLETNSGSPIFDTNRILATNSSKPTFFGLSKENDLQITIASENPTTYPVETNEAGNWILESKNTLSDGKHAFSLSKKDNQKLSEHEFVVDTIGPAIPTITNASWTKIQGKTEPYGFVGIQGAGRALSERYIQADAAGNFVVSFNQFNREYFLAAADKAGNVSKIVHLLEKDWQEKEGLSTWQLLRPYLTWALLIALTASGITYARRVKI